MIHVKFSDGTDGLPVGYPANCTETEEQELLPGFDAVWTVEQLEQAKADMRQQFEASEFFLRSQAVAVPRSVTRRQAKQALLLAGLLGSVQSAIDAIPDPVQRAMIQIEWDDSQEFERDRPALIALGAALGLDSAALDQLFIGAASL